MVALPVSVFELRCENSLKPDLTAICAFLLGDEKTTSEIRTWLRALFEPVHGSLSIGGRKVGRLNTIEQCEARTLIHKLIHDQPMTRRERNKTAEIFDGNGMSSCRVRYRPIKRGRGDAEIIPHYSTVMFFYDEKDRLEQMGAKPIWDTAIENTCERHGISKTTLVDAIGKYQDALHEHAQIINEECMSPRKTAPPNDEI
jgi:hypothetical protein